MRNWSAATREIANSFVTAGRSAEDEVTDGYVALSGWDSGPALRDRSIRWDDQVTTLGNLLADLADRIDRTADNYHAVDRHVQQQLGAARPGW